jgi:hypothetical protein
MALGRPCQGAIFGGKARRLCRSGNAAGRKNAKMTGMRSMLHFPSFSLFVRFLPIVGARPHEAALAGVAFLVPAQEAFLEAGPFFGAHLRQVVAAQLPPFGANGGAFAKAAMLLPLFAHLPAHAFSVVFAFAIAFVDAGILAVAGVRHELGEEGRLGPVCGVGAFSAGIGGRLPCRELGVARAGGHGNEQRGQQEKRTQGMAHNKGIKKFKEKTDELSVNMRQNAAVYL